ncbi:MAG: CocE/NonD family hydrolase [Acidobacteriaceae bacterium]|nr:CocE/NonD family hydrolase [Acidobacteriaceae bacterium]
MTAAVRSALLTLIWTAATVSAQNTPTAPTKTGGDKMAQGFQLPAVQRDYDRREVMAPMRDGVKLFTVIFVPKGAHDAPIMLTRTPYNAAAHVRNPSALSARTMLDELPLGDEAFVENGYIRVYQDVRGKYGSEGPYVMTPLPVNSGFNSTGADDTTDAWDTIEWLIKNVHESNGRVGMIGSSYEGFTLVMALLHPHPALKVAVPESPMVDGWMGDDWFHYGAFRQPNIDYVIGQMSARGEGKGLPRVGDDYTNYLNAGSAGDMARQEGGANLPFMRVLEEHQSYDAFWQAGALDKLIAKVPLTVPTMWEQGLYDQEDMWGAIHSYRALKGDPKASSLNFLVMGPWFHSQINRQGRAMGPFLWATDTANQWRRELMMPFVNQYLKTDAPKVDTPPVWVYDTGADRWDRLNDLPTSCESGCSVPSKPLYFGPGGKLSFSPPANNEKGERYTEFVSDPAKPVPYRPRPILDKDGSGWRTWLVTDQRFVDGRPDVLTFVSDPLSAPMKLSGEPFVHLIASTTGTDSDWVVKLIDVYPNRELGAIDVTGAFPGLIAQPWDMNGYELPIATDIFRGRYRTSFERPSPIEPGKPLEYKFGLPMIDRTIPAGHRIMVQVQSTLFPLYDRNPQKFVPNIFDAKPTDYEKATQRIWHTSGDASFISLPIVSGGDTQ